MRNLRRFKLIFAAGFLLSVATAGLALAADRGLPAQHGILNFGKVNDSLYRGAEPDAAGVRNLKELGVKTIIDLRTGKEVRPGEAADARAAGIIYTNIPLAGVGRPTDAQVLQVLNLIDSSTAPVFIHCEHGCDRTGTIIACYRMRHDHWTRDAALQEAEVHGISRLERGMRSFIADFAPPADGKK